MPKIDLSNMAQPYGTTDTVVNNRVNFRDRLMQRFAAHEWVRVINLDNEPFFWQYLPEHSEEFEFTPDPMKVTHRQPVEMYKLGPGESEVITGENAYVMIEALYKRLVAKKYVLDHGEAKPGVNRNFNWTDAQAQEDLIDRIYLGKEKPQFNVAAKDEPKEVTQPVTTPEAPRRLSKVS